MEILDKVVGAEPGVETDPMGEANQKSTEAGRHLALGLTEAVEAISLWGRTVLAPALKRVGQEWQKMYELMERNRVGKEEEELALMKKARSYGLSERVISLCRHRKERVRKKNLNRLKKEVLRYERSRRNTRGQEIGKPPEGNVRDYQPDESVPGEAGGPEPNG